MATWFEATICVAVAYILAISIAAALMGAPFNALSVAGSIFILLSLQVAFKVVTKRRK
jgi:hypothetical protein